MVFPYTWLSPRVRVAALASLLAMAACASSPTPAPPAAPSGLASVASVASVASAPPDAASEPSAPAPVQWQPTRDPVQVKLCTEGELRAARDEFQEISRAMARDGVDEATARRLRDRTADLLRSPCYGGWPLRRIIHHRDLREAAGAQFREWWHRGGHHFLSGPLDHANAVHLAPSLPRVLTPETLAANDPLRAIVCPSDAVCDPLAEGARLDITREINRVINPHIARARHGSDTTALDACARAKPGKPDEDPLDEYLSCVDHIEPVRMELPIAHYRSPKGWLVMRGRRGHHGFCDEIRAYDLATGAAYIASRCAGLVLKNDGRVDQAATSKQGQMQTLMGTVSIDGLRHLSLMLWLQDSLIDNQHVYARYPLPESIPMPRLGGGFGTGMGFRSGWHSTEQTNITFSIVDSGRVLRAGTFVWPDASTADQVIDDLLVSTEATFQPGCPPAVLPANLARTRSLGGVNPLDASAESLRASAEELSRTMADLKPGKDCRK